MESPMKPKDRCAHQRSEIFAAGDPLIMSLLSTCFTGMGLGCQTFTDTQEAFKAFASANPRPTVLITSCFDQKGTGLRWIKRCKKLEPGVKIIIWSGYEEATVASLLAKAEIIPDRRLPKGREGDGVAELAAAVKHLLRKVP
jgi:DNA-binding NtrC family response regulator